MITTSNPPNAPRGLVLAVFGLLTLIWGSTWLAIKVGLEDLPPIGFAGVRFVVAVAILAAIARVRGAAVPRTAREYGFLLISGLLAFSVNYGLLFWGEQYTSAGLAAVLQATIPVFSLFVAPFHLPGERLTARRLLGTLLGVAGVSVIFSNQLSVSGPRALAGALAIVVGAFAVAWSNVMVKAKGLGLDPGVTALFQMLFGMVPLVVVGWAVEGSPFAFHWTLRAVLCLLYLSVAGSAVAFLLFYWLLRHMEISKAQLMPLLTPIVAIALGYLLLGEVPTWRAAAGGATVLLGVAVTMTGQRR